jgi:hypothetical protein
MDLLLQKVLEYLNSGHGEEMPPELSARSSQQSQEAIKQTMKLNSNCSEQVLNSYSQEAFRRRNI